MGIALDAYPCRYCGRPVVPGRFSKRCGDGDNNHAHAQCQQAASKYRGLVSHAEPDAAELAEIEARKAEILSEIRAREPSGYRRGPRGSYRQGVWDDVDAAEACERQSTSDLVREMAGVRRRLKLRALPPSEPRPWKESEPMKEQHDTPNGTTVNRFGACPTCGNMRSAYNGRCYVCRPGSGKKPAESRDSESTPPDRLQHVAAVLHEDGPSALTGARRELASIGLIIESLEALDPAARRRALAFATAYYAEQP